MYTLERDPDDHRAQGREDDCRNRPGGGEENATTDGPLATAQAKEHDKHEGGRDDRERESPAHGVHDQPYQRKIKKNCVAGSGSRQRSVAKGTREGQRLNTVVLHAAWIEVLDVVVRRVVPVDAVGEREVERRHAEHGELREVGVVRQCAVDRREHGARRNVRRSSQHTGGVEIAWSGLEHVRTSGRAPCLEIERDADVLRPRMLAHERRCPKQTGFFTIRKQRDDVVRERRPRSQRAECLEYSR